MAAKSKMRVPPHSEDAELGVLGSILLDASTGDTRVMDLCVRNGITEESFFSPANQLIYSTLLEMANGGLAIDVLTLNERLRALNRLDQVGGTAALQNLIDRTPTAAHAEYYINILRDKHMLRRVIECAHDAERRCFEDAVSANIIVGEVEQHFMGISGQNDGTRVTWPQALTNTMEHIDRIFSGEVAGMPTGLANLDRKLKGLRNGEMIVLAARPSMGKTSLAMNIAECVALGQDIYGRPMKGEHNRPHGVGVFSLEMSTEALAMRMLCGKAGVSGFEISGGSTFVNTKAVTQKLSKAATILQKAPIFVDDTGGLDVMDMRARARRMKRQRKIELIVIDYLQLCNCREFAKQGRQIETSQISGQIKAMAKELNLPVIVLSQLSRAPEQRRGGDNKPKLSDLRDSGAIEQDADVALLLRRPCKSSGDPEFEDLRLAIVDVAKHRNGPTGEVRLDFDDSLTRFGDRADPGSDPGNMEPTADPGS